MRAAQFTAAVLALGVLAGPALAQEPVTVALNPTDPIPAPDPHAWWTDEWPARPQAADPLGDRRPRRGERPAPVENGVPALLYRLWGLPPLQDQLVRRGEMILEIWARPAQTVRQAVARVTIRDDGRAFVQGRAGLGCCDPHIARRVGFDEELARERAAPIEALRDHPMWSQPRLVKIVEDGQTVDPLCIDGVSYDATLVVPGGARHLHRACIGEEIGSIAPALSAVLSAALGYDPRFDVVFPRGADFSQDRGIYEDLVARGGEFQPARHDRPHPPMVPLVPLPPEEPPAPEPAPEPAFAPVPQETP